MQQKTFEIMGQKVLAPGVYEMHLQGDTSAIVRPGQFVNIALPGCTLRRPISVCDLREQELVITYRVVGRGTDIMSTLPDGTHLDLLTGLGNGFDPDMSGESPLLLGGGIGVPPLYLLAKCLREQGKDVQVCLGFNTASEVFYENAFRDLGCKVLVCTADGSYGTKGFVTAGMDRAYTYTYACGPLPMLRAVYDASNTDGEYSFEARMGCGFGACMGCSMMTRNGSRRVCREGAVFRKEEILWT